MIRLVRADTTLRDAALQGDDALERALGVEVVPVGLVHRGASATRDAVAADPGRVAQPRLALRLGM